MIIETVRLFIRQPTINGFFDIKNEHVEILGGISIIILLLRKYRGLPIAGYFF